MTNNKPEIRKLKNFDGHFFCCGNCGRQIAHAYKIVGNDVILGSECVKKITGFNTVNQLKIQDSRMKHFNYFGEDIAKNLNLHIDDVFNGIMSGNIK
jgi:hypothetical protein